MSMADLDQTLAFTALLELHPTFGQERPEDHQGIISDLASAMTTANPKDRWAFAKTWIADRVAADADPIEGAAQQIASEITTAARGSGSDPIAWVTGNAYMPPLRSFSAAEAVYQADEDGEDFARLTELVEQRLEKAGVTLECPDYDNALYAVDTRRFEYVDDPGDHETLQQDWQPKLTAGAVQVKRDGAVQETFNSPDPVKNSNDAFAWLLKHQGQSVDHATRHEGWEITDPAPCPACGCHHEGTETS